MAARARGACFKAARNDGINQKYASKGIKFKDDEVKNPVDLKTNRSTSSKETPLRKRRVTLRSSETVKETRPEDRQFRESVNNVYIELAAKEAHRQRHGVEENPKKTKEKIEKPENQK